MSLQLTEFASQLHLQGEILKEAPRSIREGKLKRVSGIVLEVEGLPMSRWSEPHLWLQCKKR